MNTIIKAIIVLSVGVNGFLGGLIVGHYVRQADLDCCCDCKHPRRDEGPFPTGWVMPDPDAPKPKSGAAQ
jgi:hypothetical protein